MLGLLLSSRGAPFEFAVLIGTVTLFGVAGITLRFFSNKLTKKNKYLIIGIIITASSFVTLLLYGLLLYLMDKYSININ